MGAGANRLTLGAGRAGGYYDAHGFSVLEDDTMFQYKCTRFYNKSSEKGIRYDDATLNIDWGVGSPIVSEKDLQLISFNEYKSQSIV